MAGAGFKTAHIDEIPSVPEDDPHEPHWKPIRHHFGVSAFGVNLFVAKAPGDLIEEHDEAPGDQVGTAGGHEELYFVARGHAVFTIDGDDVDAPDGTFVFVRPEAQRAAVAREPGTTILVVGGAPGEAFVASPWEEKYTRELVAG